MIDFNNLKTAFSDKSDSDLNRAYVLFKSMNNRFVSKILIGLVQFSLKLHLPIKPIIKATVYKHFCGGETIKESQTTIDKLWQSRIGTILDFSAEGKESANDFNRALKQTLASIEKAAVSDSIPFSVFKPTGLTPFALLEKMSENSPLTIDENKQKKVFINRIDAICNAAATHKVAVFIDAEESWIQDAIDTVALTMMRKYNTQKAWIYNTVQLYRNDKLTYLNQLISTAKTDCFYLGVKLVRGAYHEQEIARAKAKNYLCPVHTIKATTDIDYNAAVKLCIQNIDTVSVCAGTHNEESSAYLTQLMETYNIDKEDDRIFFSQLLGMSDHISYNLAKAAYNVSKYVPYGPVKDVLPYLIRRAEENISIAGQIGRELNNIIAEKQRRKNS